MSGVTGVMSTKLVLTAGMALFSARIARHQTPATLNPSLPKTEIQSALAGKLHVAAGDGKMRAIGIDHSEVRVRTLAVREDTERPLVIGADVLGNIALSLDFKSKRLRVMQPVEAHRITAQMTALNAVPTTDGCFSFAAVAPDGRTVVAALADAADIDTSSPATTARIGALTLITREPAAASRCSAASVVIDWNSFANRRIVMDIEHGKLWL
jgi:hypothetical protein